MDKIILFPHYYSLCFFICLILMVGQPTPVHAVTNAELEALEKQIEQLESDEKKQVEAAAKRKAEVEKQRLEETRRITEEKRMAEEARQAELERQRQDEESKKRAEEEKKEKYNLLITEAEQAVRYKDKNLAISNYEKALVLYPEDKRPNLLFR